MTLLHSLYYFTGENNLSVVRYKVMQMPAAESKGKEV